MNVLREDVTEYEPHRFSAFASDLGLRPGQWPELLTTTLGNGQQLVRTGFKLNDGEVEAVEYRQLLGCISLNVFND